MKNIFLFCTTLLLLTHASPLVFSQDLPNPSANFQTIPAGSFIVPMDTNLQNIVPAGYAPFNLKAYGLVNNMLQNHIPVKWVIKSGKNLNGIDFSAQAECISPSYIAGALLDFKGGPFIIPDTTLCSGITTLSLIQAFGNNVKVYRLTQNVTVDVRYTITHRPKIAVFNNGGNQLIHTTYLDAAGIPNYDVMDASQINNLYNCYTFASEPHWEISTTNPSVITGVKNFVLYGGNFLAECAAVENYERTGFIMSTKGSRTTNIGNIIHAYHNADLAYMQFHGFVYENKGGSTNDFTLDTGSTWRSYYYPAITHIYKDTVMACGAKLRALSAIGGNVFYLGAHNYFKVQNNNYDFGELIRTNAVRMYLNAVFIPAIDNNVWGNAGPSKALSCPGSTTLGCNPSASAGATVSWLPANGLSCTSCPNPVASPTVTTTYTLTVTGGNGCIATDTVRVSVSPITLSVTPTPATCSFANGIATVVANGGQTPFTYSWSPSGQTTSTATGLSGGTYVVVIADANGCTKTDTVNITTTPSPSVTATSTQAGCTVANGSATANPSGGTPGYSYLWNNGQTTQTATGLSAGNYSVTVTDANGCAITNMVLVAATASPSVTATSTQSGCGLADGTATANPSGGTPGYSYLWNNGQTTQTATGLAAGNYSVTVSDSNGCTNATMVNVTSLNGPVAAASSASVTCYGGNSGSATVNCTGGTPGYAYLWNNGQTTSTATGLSAGTYTITVTDANNCTYIATTTVIQPPLITGTTTSAPICSNNNVGSASVTASGGTGTLTYTWNTSPVQSTPSATGLATGNYTVTVSDANGCTIALTQSVTVNPLPTANMTGSNVCFNNANNFTDLSIGNNTISGWAWDFGDGTTSLSQNPSHTYTTPGTYNVTLTVTNNFGCVSTNTITVAVNPLPVANFNPPPVCFGSTTCFSDLSSLSSGNITGWSWNFGDANSGANNISNLQNPCHTFSGPGQFTVMLTITSDSGCQSTTRLPATVNPRPVAAFINTAPCVGANISFTDGSLPAQGDPIISWNWSMQGGIPSSSTSQNPVIFYPAAGTYTTALIITSKAGCTDTVLQKLIIYADPVALFSAGDSGCLSVCTTFKDLSQAINGTIASWQWSFPNGRPSSSAQQNPAVCYNGPGSYGATLIVTTNYGCRDTIQLNNMINVFSPPKADFCIAPDKAPTANPVFNFCPLWSPDVTQWAWDFGDGSPSDSINTNPVHSYSAVATNNDFYTYTICIRVRNQHGCWDTICKPVELIPEFTFYIPNCVTPNGDGINEFFFGKSRGVKDYNIWVFDRWGNLLWDCHHDGKNTDWDMQGQDGMSSVCKWDARVVPGGMDMSGSAREIAQEDVYVWKVQLTDIFNKMHTYIGHVSIVK